MAEKQKKLGIHTVPVPIKGPGNAIMQKEVQFEVTESQDVLTAVPMLSTDEMVIANLPDALHFRIVDGQPVSTKGPHDGNFHVIQDLAALLNYQSSLGE
ncbi:hypothetical protein EXU57_23355 [Segetibacter sp. 3557_3]|uniref:hypothetical protein n=1 Tax=Segetibacter sp. 3557_3 TaxID=2547429 RepID=UPI001058F63B|nr:hypothetical protein [Segetibacter sp. 3557_3]TDH18404.1 hypothetical protein EXU57_23355 [Segetibacter sp. 3557_3]